MSKISSFLRNTLIITTLLVAIIAISISYIQKTIWWAGYDVSNCPGCKAVIDWSSHNTKEVVTSENVETYQKNGVIVLKNAISASKVNDLAEEVESMDDTFMTTILTKVVLRQYSKYEHKLDTRSEIVRDWAIHGPLGKWAAQLMNVTEVRLYNAEKIYSAGENNPNGCSATWHRDTVAAPFPTTAKSITINIYLDDIQANAPYGDVLIYSLGSHKNLHFPPNVDKEPLFEPSIKVGDVLAHDPHMYHTPSGRGCWNRRSLQFRYVESPTTFHFGPNRFPHGPIPWTLAHSSGVAPHGLNEGDNLQGPWYPLVYPKPLESEHVPVATSNDKGKYSWSIIGVLGVAKEAQEIASKIGIGTENCTLPGGNENNYLYFGFDGPVTSCEDWTTVSGVPVHKHGQMISSLTLALNGKSGNN